MLYPADAKTIIYDTTGIEGDTCTSLLNSTSTNRTILAGYISNKTGKLGTISIDGSIYLDSLGIAGQIQKDAYVVSKDAVNCTRENGADMVYTLVYVDRDITKTPEPIMTYGDLIITLYALLMFFVLCFLGFWFMLKSYKIKKKSI